MRQRSWILKIAALANAIVLVAVISGCPSRDPWLFPTNSARQPIDPPVVPSNAARVPPRVPDRQVVPSISPVMPNWPPPESPPVQKQ